MGDNGSEVDVDVLDALLAAQSVGEVYRTILEAANERLVTDGCGVAVQSGGEMEVVESIGDPHLDADLVRRRNALNFPMFVLRTGQSCLIDDLQDTRSAAASPSASQPPAGPARSTRSFVCVPMGDAGVVFAVAATPGAFSEADLDWLERLGSHAAAALDGIGAVENESDREPDRERSIEDDRFETFASTVSHDLRNLLTVASGRLDLLESEVDSEHLQSVQESLARMEEILEDTYTLAVEGKQVEDLSPIGLREIALDCWQTVHRGDASLQVEVDDDVLVRADKGRLANVFENLFLNAIEHGGDDVTVRVGTLPGGFYVEDDGPGVPPDERDAVFDPGHSTGEQGSGLGLSIVDTVVDAHGWQVQLADPTDGGARFEITGVDVTDA